MDTAKDELGMHMNYTDSGDQKPVSDHNNCMVKGHIISIFHSLLFRLNSNIMVKKISTIENKHLNRFPFKGGVSPYYIPHVIMDGLPLYYENHYQITFGARVHVSDEPQPYNTQVGSTIDTIYL